MTPQSRLRVLLEEPSLDVSGTSWAVVEAIMVRLGALLGILGASLTVWKVSWAIVVAS